MKDIALISLIAGIAMVIFKRPLCWGFCKLGKRAFKRMPEYMKNKSPFNENDINSLYDEESAPFKFLILGIVFIIQGIFLFFLTLFIKL